MPAAGEARVSFLKKQYPVQGRAQSKYNIENNVSVRPQEKAVKHLSPEMF